MTPITRLNVLDRVILWVAGFFGERSKEAERFLKFSLVGTFGAVVDVTTLNLLQMTILAPKDPYQNLKVTLASGTAFCAAVISNFIWNRYWTYPDSRSRSIRRQLTMFFFVNSIGLFFRSIFIITTFRALGKLGASVGEGLSLMSPGADGVTVNQLGSNIALICAIIIVLLWNFFANRHWTYNDVDS